MSYLVLSFRGECGAADYKEAERKALDMLLDIITDGFDCRYWCVQLIDTQRMRFKLISCVHLGNWRYTGWYPYREALNTE